MPTLNQKRLDDVTNMRYILIYLINRGPSKRSELSKYVERSEVTVINRLNRMMDMKIIAANGAKYSPNRTYKSIV